MDQAFTLEAEPEVGLRKARNERKVQSPEPVSVSSVCSVGNPKTKPVKRAMTDDERVVVPLLWSQVGYSVGSWDKRFAREIQYVMTDGLITEGQSVQVWRLFKRYRRQIACAEKERLLGWAEGVCRKKTQEDGEKGEGSEITNL